MPGCRTRADASPSQIPGGSSGPGAQTGRRHGGSAQAQHGTRFRHRVPQTCPRAIADMQKARNLLRDSGPLPVDLVYLCSTNSQTGVTAAGLRRISASVEHSPAKIEPPSRRSWKRLNDAQRADVAARYEAGETSTALAVEHGVAKSTILGILRANNIVVRRQPLTASQVSEAVRLYESGLSLSQVSEALTVNQETMRVAISKVGVTVRAPRGREQRRMIE